MKTILSTWKLLRKPIYVGERLKSNLMILTTISLVTALLGLILIVMDLVTHQYTMLIAAIVTTLAGSACAYLAGIRKNREAAGMIPLLFCTIAFTVYAATGAGDGTAMLWTLLLPIGVSYFVSVRYGIMLSTYYTVLFLVLFYTPLQEHVRQYYSEAFMMRFPLLFAFVSAFTLIAMVQYHKSILVENEYADRLNAEVEKQTRVARERADRLKELSDEMMQTLAVTIDAKDRYTNGHSFRVSWYSVALARSLGWTEEELDVLEREALLHDIGKIGVPDQILNKPGRLTKEEFAVMQSHTSTGSAILSRSKTLMEAAAVARSHHERYDGSGYPEGLAGEEIPLHARIVAVADAYDAMRSDRVYRKGLSLSAIREELVRGRGTQFDPQLLDRFLELADSGKLDEIANREPSAVRI